MTKLSDRPPDCCCEGCWDARSVPGLEREFLLCDYPGSPDYGHVVYYRHACQCFSVGDRGEGLSPLPAAARLALLPTTESVGVMGQARQKKPLNFNPAASFFMCCSRRVRKLVKGGFYG